MDYKQRKVTFFKNINEDLDPRHQSLEVAFNRIKTGAKHKGLVEKIRGCSDKEERTKLKKGLPCVLFSGIFSELIATKVDEKTGDVLKESRRADESLTEHSGVVILDWDGVEPHKLKPKLSKDPYILACWTSPSGNGVKALVKIDDPTRHREHYNSIIAAFSKKYGDIDPSNINPSRVCYDSYDPVIHINWDSWVWSGVLEEKKKVSVSSGMDMGGLIYDYDYTKIQPIVKYLRNAEEGERNIKMNKAGFTLGGYVNSGAFPEGLGKHILLEEYKKINPGDDQAEKTLESGVRAGKNHPIYQFANHEEEFLKEVGESELGFLSNKEKDGYDLMRWWKGDKPESWTTGFSELDPYFVFKMPSFNVMLAAENIGKTYLIAHFFVSAAINHGWSGVILAIENQSKWMRRDMMAFAAGKPVLDMTKREFLFYKGFIDDHFEFIEPDSYSIYEVFDMFDKVMARKSIKLCATDPYNSLIRKGNNSSNPYAYDVEAAARIVSYTKTRNVNFWLSVHTNSESRRRYYDSGEFAGLAKKPRKSDSEMGTVFPNKADMFMIAHRFVKHPVIRERFTTYLSSEKVKDTYTGGSIHPYGEDFSMHLNYGSYFTCTKTGERSFQPLKLPNLTEI